MGVWYEDLSTGEFIIDVDMVVSNPSFHKLFRPIHTGCFNPVLVHTKQPSKICKYVERTNGRRDAGVK